MHSSTSMPTFLTHLFDAWNSMGIRYLVLRNYDELPEYTGNDIDILLCPEQLHEAQSVIIEVVHQSGWSIHNIGEFSCKAFYVYNPKSLEQVHLDLMCGDKWYSFFFVDHELLLNSRRPYKNFYIPELVHEAAVNLMTRLLYGGYVKDKYRKGIRKSATDFKEKLIITLHAWLGQGLAKEVVLKIRAGEWTAIESLTSEIRKKVLLANLKKPLRLVRSLFSDLMRLARRWFRSPGISVVFFGPDGCGKTSVADGLKDQLLKSFYPERSIHCHWKPLPQKPGASPTEDPHALAPRNRMMSMLYFDYHYLSFLWGWWRYIKPVLFRGGLAVIDRYYYDFLVDQRRYRLNLPEWIIKLGYLFVKKPDLVFCLDADPEILQARKAEVSFEECHRQREAYRALAKGLSDGHVIDASQDLDAVVRDVQEMVLAYMEERTTQRFPKLRTYNNRQ